MPAGEEVTAQQAKDFPEGDKLDNLAILGYAHAQTLVQVLKQCGARMSAVKREIGINVMSRH